MDICVYKILNKINGCFYIGYSKNTKHRWRCHRNMLIRGDHHCTHLQRSWNIYGEQSFEFIRLIDCENVETARKEEQKLLDEYFNSGLMYNSVESNDLSVAIRKAVSKDGIQKSAESRRKSEIFKQSAANNMRMAHTPEAIAKRVKSAKESGRLNQKRKRSIFARSLANNTVVIYPSIQEASRILNISAGNIHGSCNGRRASAGNYTFSYTLHEFGFVG